MDNIAGLRELTGGNLVRAMLICCDLFISNTTISFFLSFSSVAFYTKETKHIPQLQSGNRGLRPLGPFILEKTSRDLCKTGRVLHAQVDHA